MFDVEIDITEAANDIFVEAGTVTPFSYLDTLYLKRVGPDWAGFPHKVAAVLTDQFLIEDSEAGGAKRYTTVGDLPLLKRASNDFTTFSQKNSPVVTDTVLLEDSAAGGAKKYAQLGNLPMLKRVANDFTTFARKNPVSVNDKLIIEDYDNAGVKKYIYVGDLPFGAGGAGLSTMMIGGLMTGGTNKSVLFVDGIALGQDTAHFTYDKSGSGRLTLFDANYVPAGYISNTQLAIGSLVDSVLTTGYAGVTVDNTFLSAVDNSYAIGHQVNMRLGGAAIGTTLAGVMSTVAARSAGGVSLGHAFQHMAYYGWVNGESPADEMHGIWILSGTGSEAATGTGLMTGGTFYVGPHNTVGGTLYGIDSIMYFVNGGVANTATDVAVSFHSKLWARSSGCVLPDVRGLSLDSWIVTAGSSVAKSYGIYADTSIDLGTVEKWFIHSLSTSPSLFSGEVRVPNDVYGAGWNGNLSTPTKDAVYDKIEAIIASGAVSIGAAVGGGGLPGSVLFVDGASNLAQNNNDFFWNDGNKRLSLNSHFADAGYLAGHKVNLLIEPDDANFSFLHNPGAVDWSAIYIEQDNSTASNSKFTKGLEVYSNFSGSGTGHNVYGAHFNVESVFNAVAANSITGLNILACAQSGPAPTSFVRGIDVSGPAG